MRRNLILLALFATAAAYPQSFRGAPLPDSTLEEAQPRIVRSIQFRKFPSIKTNEILDVLKKSGVHLPMEQPLDRQELDYAQRVIAAMLLEKGKRGYHVVAHIKDNERSPQTVDLTFTAVKD